MKKLVLFALVTSSLLFSISCDKDDDSIADVSEVPAEEDLVEESDQQGVDRYLGVFTPVSSVSEAPGLTEYTFSGADGPICFTGNQFSMFTRDGSSNNLLIFLQGGGFCSPNACDAVDQGLPFVPFGILDPEDPENPAVNYNVGYVPYCDGSAMMGDNEVDSDGDGVNDRFFRGVQNLSASLDVIAQSYPAPEKIVLAGNSAGGFAVHAALPLVRKLYPNVRIDVINDSGVGIASPGLMQSLIDYWNAGAFFPSSCADCIGTDGNLTDYHKNQLAEDPNTRLAYISSKQDATAVGAVQGGGTAFEAELIEASEELKAAFPDRFNGLIANGEDHTFLLRDFTFPVGNTSVRSWVSDMINETADWEQVIEGSNASETNLIDATINHDNLQREYLLYIPESYTAEEPVPLVFSLHGAGGTKESQYNLSQFNLLAESENFILVTPEATAVAGPANVWNQQNNPDGADDVGFINALIDEIAGQYNIDMQRIYLAGSSNGAFMALQITCELSDRIAATAAIKGYMTPDQLERCNPTTPTAIIQMHGTEDPLVPYEGVAATIEFWSSFNQTNQTPDISMRPDTDPANGNTTNSFLYTDGTNETQVEHLEVVNGVHDWFGEPGTNYDINASLEAWLFFDKFDLNGLR